MWRPISRTLSSNASNCLSSTAHLRIDHIRKSPQLVLGQVGDHVLGIGIDQIALLIAEPVVDNHPGAASFPSTRLSNAQLAKPAATRNQVPSGRILQQSQLQLAEIVVRKQLTGTADEERKLDKNDPVNCAL